MNSLIIKDILRTLEGSISGTFNTPETLSDASAYAVELLDASGPDQMEMSTLIALGNYHNALVHQIKNMVEDAVLASQEGAANEG